MVPSMYGIQSAKIRGIFWRITPSRNSEPILLGVIACMQRYHRIAGICARQDRTGRRSFLIPPRGSSHTIYKHIRNGFGTVSMKDNYRMDHCATRKVCFICASNKSAGRRGLTIVSIELSFAAAFCADSSYLVTASSDSTARLWNLRTGDVVRQYHGHQSAVTCVALNDSSV